MIFNLLSSEKTYFSDTLEPISLWLTIGFIVAILLTIAVCFFIDKKSVGIVAKNGLIAFIFYALVMGIVLLGAEISKKYDLAYLENNWVSTDIVGLVFIPLLVALVIALVGGIVLFILTKKESKAKKIFSVIYGALLGVAVVVFLVLTYIYFSNNINGDGYYTSPEAGFNSTVLYIASGVLVLLIVGLSLFLRKKETPFTSKSIAFAGATLALSFALSYIKFEAAFLQGGSITLFSFLPICLFAYTQGMKKGLLVGFIYGLLQAIQDPFIIHPAQFLLDYPIAFSSIALSGLLTDLNVLENSPRLKFSLGILFTGIFRYIAHTVSGVFAFGAYALDSGATNFLTYSAVYNTYVLVDIALVIVAGCCLLSSKGFTQELNKTLPQFDEGNN